MNIETREQIQSKLDVYKDLTSLSFRELLELSKDASRFDYFMDGLAGVINHGSVCYIYSYFGVIKEMINNNWSRVCDNEKLSQDIFHVLHYLEKYDKNDCKYKKDFIDQYEALVVSDLKLNKLGISLQDFYKNAANIFQKIENDGVEEVKTDKCYIATISYLSKYHPEYFRNWYMIPAVYDTIYRPNKEDFEDKKDYKAFKKVVSAISSNMSNYSRERAKVMSKQPHGYKW